MTDEIRYLSVEEVIAINVAMIQRYSPDEQIGVRDQGLLESAVMRPKQSAFGEDAYPPIFEKAAALFESLGQNHPFHNANKRTAFTALIIFLKYNQYAFEMSPKEAEDFTVAMVNHEYSFQSLTKNVEVYSVKSKR